MNETKHARRLRVSVCQRSQQQLVCNSSVRVSPGRWQGSRGWLLWWGRGNDRHLPGHVDCLTLWIQTQEGEAVRQSAVTVSHSCSRDVSTLSHWTMPVYSVLFRKDVQQWALNTVKVVKLLVKPMSFHKYYRRAYVTTIDVCVCMLIPSELFCYSNIEI